MRWFLGGSGYVLDDSIGKKIKEMIFERKNLKNKHHKAQNVEIVEGKKTEVKLERYERNKEAREECIKKYGFQCKICGFDFEKTYGELGKGFIQVHHIKELSKIKKEHKVDPVKDLVPVCPNCHAMIHRKKTALKVEKLREIIKNQKTKH